MSPKVLCFLVSVLTQDIFPLQLFCECQGLTRKTDLSRECKQRIGFRVYGVVEKPNGIVKFRGSEQQETTSILRSEGPKGRVLVFKTTPTCLDRGVHPEEAGATEALLLLQLQLKTEEKRESSTLLSPLFHPPIAHPCVSPVRLTWRVRLTGAG